MPNEPDLQEVLRRNLRVLTALRRMTQKELAAALDTDRSTIAKRMNGQREWALQDLAKLAEVFGVNAQDLIGDVTDLVNVAHPLKTGTDGVTARVTSEYVPGNTADVIPFPQAREPRMGYYSKRTTRARKLNRPRTRRTGRHPFAEAAV